MRIVIQRVSEASVKVEGNLVGSIQEGLLLLVGVSEEVDMLTIDKMAHKIVNMRIFEDEDGKMNRSILDVGGKILSISQFTLFASCKKGNRPSFSRAAKPDVAKKVYEAFNASLRNLGMQVETGVFGAHMKVSLLNDGPVTILLDSEEL